jgi:hypothetical protein
VKKLKKKKRVPAAKPEDLAKSLHILDVTSVNEIRDFKQKSDQWYKYHNEYYGALAFERTKIREQLQDALKRNASSNYAIEKWSRVVKFKYSLAPLSSKGSVATVAGGRFNIGDIDPLRYPAFPALYLAEDGETARLEVYGRGDKSGKISAYDFALENENSHSLVRVSGRLESVLDLTKPGCLKDYFKLIQPIKFPKYLIKTARILGLPTPRTVKTDEQLLKSIFSQQWRFHPIQCDIPSNSQILGQLAFSAGLQGIIYPSQRGGRLCAALFPQNFNLSESFLEIIDPIPQAGQIVTRLDEKSWKNLI